MITLYMIDFQTQFKNQLQSQQDQQMQQLLQNLNKYTNNIINHNKYRILIDANNTILNYTQTQSNGLEVGYRC